jgi:hypothetical protein
MRCNEPGDLSLADATTADPVPPDDATALAERVPARPCCRRRLGRLQFTAPFGDDATLFQFAA